MRRNLKPLVERLEGRSRQSSAARERLLRRIGRISPLQLLERFPNEQACARLLFDLRGGPDLPCPGCGSRTKWKQDESRIVFRSNCCNSMLDPLRGTFLSKADLGVRMWLYLLLTFCNRSNPLSADFVAGHLNISRDKSWRALAQIRQQIERLNVRQFDRDRNRNCNIDEFLYRPVQPSRGRMWLLGLSANARIYVEPLRSRQPGGYRDILDRLGLHDTGLFSCNLALASRLKDECALPATSCEWTMASRGLPLVSARARLATFWMFFKRSMRSGSIVPFRHHLSRYVSEYVLRFNCAGKHGEMFSEVIRSVEPLR